MRRDMKATAFATVAEALDFCGAEDLHVVPEVGKWVRCHGRSEKLGSKNISIHAWSPYRGIVINNRTGERALFVLEGNQNAPAHHYSQMKADIERSHRERKTVALVQRIIRTAPVWVSTPDYLKAKGCAKPGVPIYRITNKMLCDWGYTSFKKSPIDKVFSVFPMVGLKETVSGLQLEVKTAELISMLPNGRNQKHLLAGGLMKGSFWIANDYEPAKVKQIGIVEGVATAMSVLSLFSKKVDLVVAAMNAGNLPSVAQALQRLHPQARIIIFADNDNAIEDQHPNQHFSDGNIGVIKAAEAAALVKGSFFAPTFPVSVIQDFCRRHGGEIPSDWNDLEDCVKCQKEKQNDKAK